MCVYVYVYKYKYYKSHFFGDQCQRSQKPEPEAQIERAATDPYISIFCLKL